MRLRLRSLRPLLLGLLFFSAVGGIAQAAFKLDYINNTPAGGGLTSYNYNISFATLTGQESVIADALLLSPGTPGSQDFVTIYDIPGFVSSSVGANPFTVQAQLVGVNGPNTGPSDDATLWNIIFRYTGPSLTTTTTFTGISILSTNIGTGTDFYTSQQTNVSETGTKIGEVGTVTVPGSLQNIDGVVPEPTSIVIWGLGALGCAIAGFRRRRQVAAS